LILGVQDEIFLLDLNSTTLGVFDSGITEL
jgi:hypothetical protein